MNTISNVTQATGASQPDMNIEGAGELIAALDGFDVSDRNSCLPVTAQSLWNF